MIYYLEKQHSVCWMGCILFWWLDRERIHFQDHAGCWQKLPPCDCMRVQAFLLAVACSSLKVAVFSVATYLTELATRVSHLKENQSSFQDLHPIKSGFPRKIFLLINSKSIDLRTLFIFKIPSSLSISIGQKEFTGLRHTEGKGIFQDLNTQGSYHREPILEYFLPYWVTIFPRYMSYSMYFISYV